MTVDEIISALCTIRCIPKGKLPTLVSYLLCQWANNLAPAGCGTPSDVIQISGAGNGDVNGIYVRNPINLNIYDSKDDPQASIVFSAGNATIYYGLAGFERYYSTTEDFPCTWTLGLDGTLPVPTGQWLSSPPVAWAPANEPVTWQDSGGAHIGDLATFLATANFPSVNSLVFGATGNLTSLTGLKYLPSLLNLDCSTNALTSLDCTNCLALTTLNCSSNASLTTLTLTGCAALTTLNCSYGSLTILDVSTCTSLDTVYCAGDQFASLDFTACTLLTLLDCSANPLLTSLDVSTCVILNNFTCGACDILPSIDLHTCAGLVNATINNGNNLLTSINVSGCSNLLNAFFNANPILSSINVTGCVVLGTMDCSDCALTSLDVSTCVSLSNLDCDTNALLSLDVHNCTAMVQLFTYSNPSLSSINVTGLANLTFFDCNSCNISPLDVSTCLVLNHLDCHSNALSSAQVSTVLCDIDGHGNGGGILDITSNAVPTAGGLVCSANLDPGKGWTVTHD